MSKKQLSQQEVNKRFQQKGWELIDKYVNNEIKVQAICPYCKQKVFVVPHNIFSENTQSCGCVSRKLAGQNKSIPPYEKSLEYLYPEIAKLYSKNNEKTAFEIYPNNHHKHFMKKKT